MVLLKINIESPKHEICVPNKKGDYWKRFWTNETNQVLDIFEEEEMIWTQISSDEDCYDFFQEEEMIWTQMSSDEEDEYEEDWDW